MSSGKRKSNTTSDFKRIKAKVGKKAKRLNDTDVSFQSASLHLGQSIDQDAEAKKSGNSQLLISSRGKSLYQLASTASAHPAAAARTSSLKGVLDIIKKYPTKALSPNLSTLIPVCVHSCVDEDQDVRNIGIEALSCLLKQLKESKIKPFGALLIARISSALHSLDASTRVNGVKMVNILSTACPSLTLLFVDQLLRPFSGLLSDQRTKKSIDEIIQSLISVLRVNSTRHTDVRGHSTTCSNISSNDGTSKTEVTTQDHYQPDLFYFTGGRSRNTVLCAKRPVHVLPNGIESISQLSHPERLASNFFKIRNSVVNSTGRQGFRENSLDVMQKTNLMSQLRDCLIESINLEHEPAMVSIKTKSTTESQESTNYSRVILLLRAIRYLSTSIPIYDVGLLDGDRNEFDKVAQQIVGVLVDIFPLDQNPSGINAARAGKSTCIDDVNAAIAMSILDLSQNTCDEHRTDENNLKDWMKTICSYVIPRINHLRTDQEVTTSSSDLDLTCRFLRRLGMDSSFSDDLSLFLDIVQESFFSHDNIQIARSIGCRRVSMIMMELIDSSHFSLADEPNNVLKGPMSKNFHRFVTFIPLLLEAWGADFVYESRRLLEGLHRLIREFKGDQDNDLAESLRENWCKLVANQGDSGSIFESYPWNLQRMYLGLMVLLEKPTEKSLKYLALICCRSTLKSDSHIRNDAIPQAIIESVLKIRKTIPMQRYLSFLFQSIGISRHVKEVISTEKKLDTFSKSVFEVVFFKADPHLARVAKVLAESGSVRILRMILPQLLSWQQIKEAEGATSTAFLLKMRASLVILAYFFLQIKSTQVNQCEGQPSIFDLIEGAISLDTLAYSICIFVRTVACDKEKMDFHVPLTSPILALMSARGTVLEEVMNNMDELLRRPDLSKIEMKNIAIIMNEWTKDPRLQSSMISLSSESRTRLEEVLTN